MRSPPAGARNVVPTWSRPGFTLVELLVAILLIDVGVLAMVSGTAMIARRQVEMRTRIVAAQTAANRIQRLIAGPCVAADSSATDARGITERWTVVSLANATRDLRDSVTFAVDGLERSVVLHVRATC